MNEKMSLTELQLIIRDSLYLSLPDYYWVTAEISEIKDNSAGHCYLELIEKHPDDKNAKARIRAIIWNNRYRFLKSFFENITGETLREGQKILVKTKVEYHELYGLSLIISDIDPAFTIGEMAIKRQIIIKKLEQEGVFTMNKELEIPMVPQRIAVISSKNAAGYADFINHLAGNSYNFAFRTTLIDSIMQGAETEKSIINALDIVAEKSDLFDLVVIIRGGGSQSDLSWFDNYDIAYHITQFPLPVITGIGHEKDMSVTDMVANVSLKTPTAVADFIIDCMVSAENHLLSMCSDIQTASQLIVIKNTNRLETAGIRLGPLVRIMLSEVKDMLSEKIISIINTGKEYNYKAGRISAEQESRLISAIRLYTSGRKSEMKRASDILISLTNGLLKHRSLRLERLVSNLAILDPAKVLARGYTITSLNGKIIKMANQLKTNDTIDNQFVDGIISSKVIERQL